jgi:hypothetical protein
MDRKHRRVYSVCGNQTLVVSDPDAGKVVTTVPIGNGPDACSFDTRFQEVFAPAGRDGTVTVIHEDTPDKYSTVATVPTQAGARTISLDDRTNILYAVTATRQPNPDPNAAGRYRFRFVPGSFVVLVVAPGK